LESAVLILVVEDEPVVRELVKEQLEDEGYKVLEAENGKAAFKLLDKHKEARGLITDIRLGGKDDLTGWDVARHARELNPNIAVVYMSADSGADWTVNGVPKSTLVIKPFVTSQISTALANLLNETG
jgi:CheY-like chemotaxis protein